MFNFFLIKLIIPMELDQSPFVEQNDNFVSSKADHDDNTYNMQNIYQGHEFAESESLDYMRVGKPIEPQDSHTITKSTGTNSHLNLNIAEENVANNTIIDTIETETRSITKFDSSLDFIPEIKSKGR